MSVFCLSVCLTIYLSVFLSDFVFVYVLTCLSVYLSICLSTYLPICLSVCAPGCLICCLYQQTPPAALPSLRRVVSFPRGWNLHGKKPRRKMVDFRGTKRGGREGDLSLLPHLSFSITFLQSFISI
jgi:hypothetical protein